MAKVVEKIKQARWYMGEKFEYEKNLKEKGKVTGYFKTVCGRYAHNRKIFRFYKVHENGIMIYVDATMMKTGVSQSVATPFQFHTSNKREFDKELKKYLSLIL